MASTIDVVGRKDDPVRQGSESKSKISAENMDDDSLLQSPEHDEESFVDSDSVDDFVMETKDRIDRKPSFFGPKVLQN